jgi:hypothetical protein
MFVVYSSYKEFIEFFEKPYRIYLGGDLLISTTCDLKRKMLP